MQDERTHGPMAKSPDVREVLEAAYKAVFECKPEWHKLLDDRAVRFRRFLDAEAYTDAALMLVPEGYDWSMDNFDGELGKPSAWVCKHGPFFNGTGETPALAICEAALRAKGPGHEQ